MKINEIIKSVEASKEYNEFKKNNKDSFLLSLFFIVSPKFEFEIEQVNYFLPKDNKVMSFILNNDGIKTKLDELYNKQSHLEKTNNELDIRIKVDLEEMKSVIDEKISNKKNGDLTKTILVFQELNGKPCWNLTFMFSGLKLLNIIIDAKTGKIDKEEVTNLADMMKFQK